MHQHWVFRVLAALVALVRPSAAGTNIRINAVGYLPTAPKLATVAASACGGNWSIVDVSSGARPLHGNLTDLPTARRGTLCLANFTALSATGTYKLVVQGVGRSPPFPVGPAALNRPFRMAMAGFYMARCGQAVPPLPESDELITEDSNGRPFEHGICHTDDALVDEKHTHASEAEVGRIDATGGWHDAGDYGKYSVNTGYTLGVLMYAWEHFKSRLECADLGLPDAPVPVPDYLDEVRWGMAWLLKMQRADGMVYHKLTGSHFEGFGELSDADDTRRFLSPVSSAATADLAATGAQCARIFALYDPDLATRCLAAARSAYNALAQNPQPTIPDLSAFGTGTYNNPDWHMDVGVRLWAATELFEATHEHGFLADAEELLRRMDAPTQLCHEVNQPGSGGSCKVSTQFDWDDQRNFGAIRYLGFKHSGRDKDPRDPALVAETTEQLRIVTDLFARTARTDPYSGPLGGYTKWGINGELARQSLVLHSAELILGANKTLEETALNTLSILFGRNNWGRSFVTQLGDWPAKHPHHRPSMVYAEAWPGLLVGGPNGGETAWSDGWLAFRSNEVAINWNAGLAYATARYYQCPGHSYDPASAGRSRLPRQPKPGREPKVQPPHGEPAKPTPGEDAIELVDEEMVWLGDPTRIHDALSQRERLALALEELTQLVPPEGRPGRDTDQFGEAEAAARGVDEDAKPQRTSRRVRRANAAQLPAEAGASAGSIAGGSAAGGGDALQELAAAASDHKHKRHDKSDEPDASSEGDEAAIVQEPPAATIQVGRRGRQARGGEEARVAPAEPPVPVVDKSASSNGRAQRKARPH